MGELCAFSVRTADPAQIDPSFEIRSEDIVVARPLRSTTDLRHLLGAEEIDLISNPVKVVERIYEWGKSDYLWKNFFVTFEEVIIGFVGMVGGVVIGVVLGISKTLGDAAQPYADALYSVPKVALTPLFVIWFGIGVEGLGYIITYSASIFDSTGLMAALIVLTFVATALNSLVASQQERSLRWQSGDR